MRYYNLNGQPTLDSGIDGGATGAAPQQTFGNPTPEAASNGSCSGGPATVARFGNVMGSAPNISLVSDADGSSSTAGITNTSTTTQTVTFQGSGIVFDNTYIGNVSAAYQSCILSAEQQIASLWNNNITINIEFDAEAEGQNGDLASNSFFVDTVSYASLKSALTSLASTEPGNTILQQAVANLPATDPSGGQGFALPLPYAQMLGFSIPSQNPEDTVTLNTSYNWSYGQDVINTVEHEISEGGMGRIGGLGDQNSFWSTMDLFRYNAVGQHDYTDGRDGQTTYFSYNGGATLSTLSFNNEFNSQGVKVNGGDVADFTQQDVFGTGDPGETNTLSQTDIEMMDALGWNSIPPPPTVTTYNQTLAAGADIGVANLFIASDPGGTITQIELSDPTPTNTGGFYIVNGVAQPYNPSAGIFITPSQEGSTAFQAGNGTDDLAIRAYNGTTWSAWTALTVTGMAPPPPTVTTYNQTLAVGEETGVANLFIASDPGGMITQIELSDPTPTNTGGFYIVNGVAQPYDPSAGIFITPSQEGSTAFQAGNGTDDLAVRAYNGTSWSAWTPLTVTGIAPPPPTVTTYSQTLVVGAVTGVANLFIASDPGGTITQIELSDPTPTNTGGHYIVDGVAQPYDPSVGIFITPSQEGSTAFQAGNGTDDLAVRAYNGTSWSAWIPLTVTGTNAASVANASNEGSSWSLADFTFVGEDASTFAGSPGQTTLTQLETLPVQSSQAQTDAAGGEASDFSDAWLENAPSSPGIGGWMSLSDIAQGPPIGVSEPEGLTNFGFVGSGTTPSNSMAAAAMQLDQSSLGMGAPWTVHDESQALPNAGAAGSSIAQNVARDQFHPS